MKDLLDKIILDLYAERWRIDAALDALEAIDPPEPKRQRKKRRPPITNEEIRDAVLAITKLDPEQVFTTRDVAAKLDAHPANPRIGAALGTFADRGMLAAQGRGVFAYRRPPIPKHRKRPVTVSYAASLPAPGTGRRPRVGRHEVDEKLRRLPPSALAKRPDGRLRVAR